VTCPRCAGQLERYRIGRGRDGRGAGVEVGFCPACNLSVELPQHAPGYEPVPRKDLD